MLVAGAVPQRTACRSRRRQRPGGCEVRPQGDVRIQVRPNEQVVAGGRRRADRRASQVEAVERHANIALIDTVVITIGMLVIGTPHVGTLALLTFVSLFVPIQAVGPDLRAGAAAIPTRQAASLMVRRLSDRRRARCARSATMMPARRRALSSQPNLAAQARQRTAQAWASSGSDSVARARATHAPRSAPGSTSQPVIPSRTESRNPGTRKATAGTP